VRVHAGKEWIIPGTNADRGHKYLEKNGRWATDAEKGIKVTERWSNRCRMGRKN
jgi:hypothetical protein